MIGNSFMRVDDVTQELGVSTSYAYKVVRKLNDELKSMDLTAIAIADRVGHESIDITYNYAHLFPSRQTEMADRLDFERTEEKGV